MNTKERKEHFDKIIKELNEERKPFTDRIGYRLFGIVLSISGFTLLCYEFGWKMLVGIFIIVWGNNIQSKIKKPSI